MQIIFKKVIGEAMKKKIICIFLPILGFAFAYFIGYQVGIHMDNDNIILKSEVESSNPNVIFLETIISKDGLDSDSIKRLEEGIEIKNISELYRTLESFTT